MKAAVVGLVPLAAVCALAASAYGYAPTETVQLRPLSGSHASGIVVAGARAGGTHVAFTLHGLPARGTARGIFQAGTCEHRSASFASAGAAASNARGVARWTAHVLFHGQAVDWSQAADGGHVLVVVAAGRAVACGVIPGIG